jgi:ubiquinone/menaquinone biosynthesis C-methylase UbiE
MFKKFLVLILKKSKSLSALSCRLTKLTGKSKYPIHPKHLIKEEDPWFLDSINNEDRVLDLGCGNGQHTLKATKRCKEIIGVDYDNTQLNIAKKTAEDKNISNVKFKKHDLEKKLPFKSNFFDKILALDVLEHLYKRDLFLKEVKRILKPKGLVFIAVPNKNTSWKRLQKSVGINYYSDPDHKIEYSFKGIKNFLKKHDFKVLSIKSVVYDTPLSGFIDVLGGLSLGLYKKLGEWKKRKVRNDFSESIGFQIKAKKTT